MSTVSTTVSLSWKNALDTQSSMAWHRIADMTWGIQLFLLNREIETGTTEPEYEDAVILNEIANWRAYNT